MTNETKKTNRSLKSVTSVISGLILIVAVCLALFDGLFFEKYKGKQIRGNMGVAYGEITKVLRGGSKGGVLKAYFRYSVDTSFYNSSQLVSSRRVLGHRFPVVYSRKEPTNCRILIEPDDFKEFGLAFPDSLR